MNIPEAATCANTSRQSANLQNTTSSKKSIRWDLFHLYLLSPSYHWSNLIHYCVCYHGKHWHRFGEARNHTSVSTWIRGSLQRHTQTFHVITHTPLLAEKSGGDLKCLSKRRKIILLESKFSFTFRRIHVVQVKFFVVFIWEARVLWNVLFP